MVVAGEPGDLCCESWRGQGPAGNDDQTVGRYLRDLMAVQGDEGVRFDRFCQVVGKGIPVDGEGAAGGNGMAVGRGHEEAVAAAQFFLQQTDRVMHAGATQTVGTDQLTQLVALVSRRHTLWPHFVQFDGDALAGDLPGGLTACQPAADDRYRSHDVSAGLYCAQALRRFECIPRRTKRPGKLPGLEDIRPNDDQAGYFAGFFAADFPGAAFCFGSTRVSW